VISAGKSKKEVDLIISWCSSAKLKISEYKAEVISVQRYKLQLTGVEETVQMG